MAKRRYEQKNEEKHNAIRERASAFKEKEKVRVHHDLFFLSFSLNRIIHMLPHTGYDGYVSATGKAAIRMMIAFQLQCATFFTYGISISPSAQVVMHQVRSK